MMNRCLVRRAVAETKTAGGIMLPETSQSKLNIGEVLAIGEGQRVEVNIALFTRIFNDFTLERQLDPNVCFGWRKSPPSRIWRIRNRARRRKVYAVP